MTENEIRFNFDKNFQLSILKLMLKDDCFCSKCSTYLKDYYFQNKYLSWYFKIFSSYYKEYGKCPDLMVIRNEINVLLPEVQNDYKLILQDIASAKIESQQYLKDKLTWFVKIIKFNLVSKQSDQMLQDNNPESALNYMKIETEKIDGIDFSKEDWFTGTNLLEELSQIQKDNTQKIPIGIPIIDEAMVGGLPKKNVATILGGWNVGKSLFMANCSYSAITQGKRVLYISHEDERSIIISRFTSRISKIPYNKIISQSFSEDDLKKLDETIKLQEQFLRIKVMKHIGLCVEDVCMYAKEKMKEWPFDMLVVDHGQKLTIKERYRELRQNQGAVWDILDQLASELNIVVLTAAHINREGSKLSKNQHKVIRADHISECSLINGISATIITLTPTPENDLIVCLDKQKSGKTGLLVKCECERDMSITHDSALSQTALTFDEAEALYEK